MTNRTNPHGRIRLIVQRSRLATKCAVLAALVLSMAALLALGMAQNNARTQLNDLQEQEQQLELENARLEQYLEEQGSIQSIQRIAGEELGLVNPDTVIIQPLK